MKKAKLNIISWAIFFLILVSIGSKGAFGHSIPFLIWLLIIGRIAYQFVKNRSLTKQPGQRRSGWNQPTGEPEPYQPDDYQPEDMMQPQKKRKQRPFSAFKSANAKNKARRVGNSTDPSWIKDEDTWIKGD